jgi:hypothetical protein
MKRSKWLNGKKVSRKIEEPIKTINKSTDKLQQFIGNQPNGLTRDILFAIRAEMMNRNEIIRSMFGDQNQHNHVTPDDIRESDYIERLSSEA